MTEQVSGRNNLLQTRIDVIAQQAMLLTGIDYTGVRVQADGSEMRVTRTEALQTMMHHVTACPSIGNVGHALLRGADFKV